MAIDPHAEVFAEFDLDWWIRELRPILDKFVAAAEGEIDTAHWCSMYKLDSNSGGPYITGWLSLLFPYLRHRPAHDAPPQLVPNQYLRGWRERMLDEDSFGGAPTTDAFPAALACVPMRWKYLDQLIPMQLLAGFAGVRQDPTTLEVTPQLGWAVRDQPQP